MKNKEFDAIILWAVLALVAFIASFWIPVLWVKIIQLVFGGLNMLVVLSWVISSIQARKEYKKNTVKEE